MHGMPSEETAYRRNQAASSYTYCSLTAMVCIAFGLKTYTILRYTVNGDKNGGTTVKETVKVCVPRT